MGVQHHFEALCKGLIKGDREHGGNQSFAGEDAATAQVTFIEWWEKLKESNPTLYQKIRTYTIIDIREGRQISMSEVLDPIVDARGNADRNSTVFCVETMGRRLSHFLSNKDILDEMTKDAKLTIKAKSLASLDSLRGEILDELAKGKGLPDDVSVFSRCFEKAENVLPWLFYSLKESLTLSYLDIQHIAVLLNKSRNVFDESLLSFLNPKPLLIRDKKSVIETALEKDFRFLLLHLIEQLKEDDFYKMSYKSLKASIQLLHVKKKQIPDAIIKHSLNAALASRDGDWILFFDKERLT